MLARVRRFLPYALVMPAAYAMMLWSLQHFAQLFKLLEQGAPSIRIHDTAFSLMFILCTSMLIYMTYCALQGFPDLQKKADAVPATQKARDLKLGLYMVGALVFSFLILGGTKLVFKIIAYSYDYEICESEREHGGPHSRHGHIHHKLTLCKK